MKLRTTLLAGVAIALSAIVSAAQVPGVNSNLSAVFNLAYDNSTMKPTYSATQSPITLASAATDVCILNGSATKNVRVRRVLVGGIASAVAAEAIQFLLRSTANTGGTGNIMASVPYDSINSLTGAANVATAVAEFFITNPTQGTLIGSLADIFMTFGNLTTGVGSILTYEFGARGSPVVLRGVAQGLAINLGGQTISGGILQCTFEWTEE